MLKAWRTGFGVDPRLSGLAPIAALVIGGVSVLLTPSGDLREGFIPWGMSVAVALLSVCSVGVLSAHGPQPGRWVVVGGWWTAAANVGIALFFLAVGVGSVLGIDEETESPLALLPLAAMTFGIVSNAPALAALAFGITRAHRLSRWGAAAAWLIVLALPSLLVFGGLAEGTAESIGSAAIMVAFVSGWIVLGLASRVGAARSSGPAASLSPEAL